MSSPALDEALRAAFSTDPNVRQEAALRLGTLADASLAPRLVTLLVAEPDFYVRETLTWAVVSQAETALPHLLEALEGEHPSRVQVLHALSKIRDPRSVSRLLPLADDPDDAVAARAWWALGRTGTPEAVPALLAHVGDPDEARRRELTRALEQLGEPAVGGLADLLWHGDGLVRRHAAEALSAIGDPRARGAADALAHAVVHDDKDVALVAIEALAGLDVPDVDATLERLRDSGDGWLAITAEWLLSDRAEKASRRARRAAVRHQRS
jgi:HEAT repeat protein